MRRPPRCAGVLAAVVLVPVAGCESPAVVESLVRVVSVSDGDTFDALTDRGERVRVRLLGVDAPELAHGRQPAQCGAAQAKKVLQRLLGERRVVLRTDPVSESVDRYGRRLGYVEVAGEDAALVLLQAGVAAAWHPAGTVPPTRFGVYLAAELAARNSKAGSWASCATLGR